MKAFVFVVVVVGFVITPMPAHGGTKKTSAPVHSDLTVTKKDDKASPALSQNSTTPSPHLKAAPVKKAAKKTVISEGVLNNKAITKPQPAYPPIAK